MPRYLFVGLLSGTRLLGALGEHAEDTLATRCRGERHAGHPDRDFRETSRAAVSTALKKRRCEVKATE